MNKVGKVMHEFREGELHSGSKHGPKVSSRKQAVAIALSEAHKSKKERKQKVVHDHPTLRVVGDRVKNSTAKEDAIRAIMNSGNQPIYA